MNNVITTIAIYHLRKNILSRSFLFSVMGMPSLFLVAIGLSLFTLSFIENPKIGAVDPDGILQDRSMPETPFLKNPEIIIFPDRSSAMEALDNEKIGSIYILPHNYPTERKVELIYHNAPSANVQEFFIDILKKNLLAGFPDGVINRVINRPVVVIHSLETNRVFTSSGPNLGSLLPTMLGVIFVFAIFPVSEMLVGALGDEKANRTMEVMLTSLKPSHLIAGKLFAAAGMVLSLMLIWIAMIGVAYGTALSIWPQSALKDIQISANDVLQIILLVISGLVFAAALLIFFGAILNSEEEVKQAAGMVLLPFMLPIYVLPILIQSPNSPLGLLMSLLPFTSTLAIGIQSLFEAQPWWKVLLAFSFQISGAMFFVWLAGRAFRYGMLRYGKSIRLKELFQRDPQRKARRV